MALLSCTNMHLGRTAVAGVRRLIPAVQHTVLRHRATETDVSAKDSAAYTAPEDEAQVAPLVFAPWSVYKSKGAVTVKPQKAEWGQTANGSFVMSKPGSFRFEVAAVLEGTGTGPGERRYKWDQKVIIDMSAMELSAIFAQPDQAHEYYHDSYKGQRGREGTVTKTFKWSVAPDGNAYYINTSMRDTNNNINYNASVSLSCGEFFVLKELVRFGIPYVLGWADMVSR